MPITRDEFEKLPEMTLHGEYVQKLKEIGEKLGFATGGLKTGLGTLDCIWRLKDTRLLRLKFIPLVTFEVICSENQKAIRGSFLNMLAMKPALAVFVLVKKGIKQHSRKEPEKWLKRIQTFVKKLERDFFGILRIAIWEEDDVDKMYLEIVKKEHNESSYF